MREVGGKTLFSHVECRSAKSLYKMSDPVPLFECFFKLGFDRLNKIQFPVV